MRLERLIGRAAVITGGAGGIGRSIALAMASAGFDIVIADRELAPAELVRDEVRALGRRAIAVETDVADLASVERLAAISWAEFGSVAVLVNNAGVTWRPYRASWDASVEDFTWIMSVNFGGVLHGHRAFVPRMLEAGLPAHIVNTSSRATLQPTPGHSAYAAAKSAIDGFSMTTRAEFAAAGFDIGVTVLHPGPVRTGFSGSERFRPEHERSAARSVKPWQEHDGRASTATGADASGAIAPDIVGRIVLEAIDGDHPAALTHPTPPAVAERADWLTRAGADR